MTAFGLKTASLGKRLGALVVDLMVCAAVSAVATAGALRLFVGSWRGEIEQLVASVVVSDSHPRALLIAILSAAPSLVIWFFVTAMTTLTLAMAATHFYFVYFESRSGATPGKKLTGIRVVSSDGLAISRKQAIWRELGRWYLDFSFLFPTLIALAVTKRRQRIGDLIAKTWVVESPGRKTQEGSSDRSFEV